MSSIHAKPARISRALFASILAFGISCGSAIAKEITVTHWGASFFGAPYAVAMEKGWFKSGSFDVTGILTSTGGGTSVRNVLASDTPVGEVALPAAIEAMKAGVKLKIFFSGVSSNFDTLWATRPGEPFKSLQDLKGKKIGYTRPASTTHMMILMGLEASGMKPSDVELIPIGSVGANMTAVLQGAVDAAAITEPVWTREKDKLQPVFWAKDVIGSQMTQTVGVTTEKFAKENPEVLKAIIEGRRKGVQFIYEHPEEAAAIVAKAYNTDPELLKAVLKEFVKARYWDEGKFDYTGLETMVRGLRIVGQLKGAVNWAELVDQNFLPADLRVTQ